MKTLLYGKVLKVKIINNIQYILNSTKKLSSFFWILSLTFTPFSRYVDCSHKIKLTLLKYIITQRYLEPCQISKMKLSQEIINGWNSLTIFTIIFIVDVWHGSKYASGNVRKLSAELLLPVQIHYDRSEREIRIQGKDESLFIMLQCSN